MTTTSFGGPITIPIAPKPAATLEEALQMVQDQVDAAYKRYLTGFVYGRSNSTRLRLNREYAWDLAWLEAMLNVWDQLQGYRKTKAQLQSESYQRIGGEAIVERSQREVQRLREQAKARAAR